MHGILRDQARRQLLGERRVALMVDEGQLELGAALVGQAFGRGQRQIAQLGMFVVDDLGGDFRRRLRRLPGGSRVARERPQNADLDGPGGLRRRRRDQGDGRSKRGRHHRRSEEHTSELQSRENLVCRLLLEKKKKKKITHLIVKKKKHNTQKKKTLII